MYVLLPLVINNMGQCIYIFSMNNALILGIEQITKIYKESEYGNFENGEQ